MSQPLFILLGLLLAFSLSQAKLDVLKDPTKVPAKPGDKVELKCILKLEKEPLDLKELTIQWFFRGKQVAEFDRKITIDKPGLSLSEEALKKGDGTLTIASAKEEDSGSYRCYLNYKELSVVAYVLTVEDPSKPKEEETFDFSDTFLTRKVNKVIEWCEKFDTKMAELLSETKKCQPEGKASPK